MHRPFPTRTVAIGAINERSIQLSPAVVQASAAHAARIARELGLGDAESSLAAYWTLAARVRQWQQLVERLGWERARRARFLELGSGLGLFTLVGRALGLAITGVEASDRRYDSSLRIAQQLFADNAAELTLVQAVSEAIPLPSASVDVVAAFQTFEHVNDLPQTLREIRRVLRPGGLLFAQAPNYTSLYETHYGVFFPLGLGKTSARRYLGLRRRPTGFVDHLQWLAPAQLRRQLAETGFHAIAVTAPSAQQPAPLPLPVELEDLPFHFRRGRVAERMAYRLAFVARMLKPAALIEPQLEIWATA